MFNKMLIFLDSAPKSYPHFMFFEAYFLNYPHWEMAYNMLLFWEDQSLENLGCEGAKWGRKNKNKSPQKEMGSFP